MNANSNCSERHIWHHVWWRLSTGVVLLALAFCYGPLLTPDFGQDYAAARGWRQGNDPNGRTVDLLGDCCPALSRAYTHLMPDMQTAHPPMATLLALPLSALSWPTARTVWLLLSWCAVLAAWQYRQVAISVCMATVPLWVFVLGLGTHEALLFLLLAVTFSADERHSMLAGIPLGFSIALKVYPGLLLAGFAANRRWSAVIVSLATGLGLVLLSEIILGPGVHLAWLRYVPVNTANFVDDERNVSLARILHLMLPHVSPVVLSGILAAVLTVPLLRPRGKSVKLEQFVPNMLLASPLAWRYYWTALSLQQLRRFDLLCLFLPPTILLLGLADLIPVAGWNRWSQSIIVLLVQLPLLIVALRLWYSAVCRSSCSVDVKHRDSAGGHKSEMQSGSA